MHFPKSMTGAGRDESKGVPATQTLDVSEPGQRWETKFELGSPSTWHNGIADGMIYVFHGAQEVDGHPGRVHYGIVYHISIEGDRISPDSELWMGSLYNLNGRVLVPSEKTILLDRWFDFRPIPEIEGENTTSPELLGIPEHMKKSQ